MIHSELNFFVLHVKFRMISDKVNPFVRQRKLHNLPILFLKKWEIEFFASQLNCLIRTS